MNKKLRTLLLISLSSALFFGFWPFFPAELKSFNFERLHVFLLNLCSGGTIIINHTENGKRLSYKTVIFFILSVIYAFLAFSEKYLLSILVAFIMFYITEMVRVKKFSVFPIDFFKRDIPVYKKFHHAALLCLSLSILFSALVIINNHYFILIENPKLKLDVFFLGFSFPVSLITMSVMFSFIELKAKHIINNIYFWIINIGVIIFFIFILAKQIVAQLIVASVLFMSVVLLFYLFYAFSKKTQERTILTSGLYFIILTGFTGIAYVIFKFTSLKNQYETIAKTILMIHSYISLYGWNLSGIFVLSRNQDFPLQINIFSIILLNWMMIIFALLGRFFIIFDIISFMLFIILLFYFFFSDSRKINSINGACYEKPIAL